jgi:polysaccharide biosynthesis transport protein
MPDEKTLPQTVPDTAGLGEALDLQALWRTIYRRRWLVIPFFVAAVGATAIVTLKMPRIYEATCTIIIDMQAPKVLDKDQLQEVVDSGTGGYWYSKEFYETQYRVITSRAVAQRVSDRLQLGSNQAFLELADVKDPAELERKRASRDPVQILLKNLKVEPVKDSRVVRLRYEDPDPALAALISNTWAEAYITESLAVKTSTSAVASEWLERQLVDLERKMEESSRLLFDFKRSNDIVATSWEDRQSMVSQRLTQINDALTRARVKRAELEARNTSLASLASSLEGSGDVAAETDTLQSSANGVAIQQLKLRYFEAKIENADLRVRYMNDHPRIEASEKKIAAARDAVRQELRSALEGARKEFQETLQTEKNLQRLLSETKSDAFSLNQHEREYLELKRSQDNNQRLYELVLKRLKDTGVTGMLQASNVRILDRARVEDKPIKPQVRLNLGLALVVGLLGGVGLAFAAETFDRTLATQEQVEEQLGLAFLGIVPRIERSGDGASPDLVVSSQPKSAVAECLRAIRTNLLFMSPEKSLKTILVTSSGPQEGKTMTATSLAITMTASGQRVLLVDADLRRPRLHRVFGVSSKSGLSNLILGEGRLDESYSPTTIPNLFVLPCGPVPPNPAELLHTAAFSKILEEMARKFDRVIIDSPPVGVVADAVVIATLVDGVLVVLKAGQTTRDAGRLAVKQLRDVKAPLLGSVLNDLNLDDQKYGHYSYYYRYGYYYGEGQGGEGRGQAKAAQSARS